MAELAPGVDRDPDKQGGEPCVAGTRVHVHRIGHLADQKGLSPDPIAERFDLSLSDVHRALAYYYDHPDEMAGYDERDRERVPPELLVPNPSRTPATGCRAIPDATGPGWRGASLSTKTRIPTLPTNSSTGV